MRLLRQAPAIAGVFRNLDRDRETSVILRWRVFGWRHLTLIARMQQDWREHTRVWKEVSDLD
jgi:hypothetical protein